MSLLLSLFYDYDLRPIRPVPPITGIFMILPHDGCPTTATPMPLAAGLRSKLLQNYLYASRPVMPLETFRNPSPRHSASEETANYRRHRVSSGLYRWPAGLRNLLDMAVVRPAAAAEHVDVAEALA